MDAADTQLRGEPKCSDVDFRGYADSRFGSVLDNRVSALFAELRVGNPDHAALTELALRGDTPARLQIARDGQEALDYLFNHANNLSRPVLLELRLPDVDGVAVLRRIGADMLDAGDDPDQLHRTRRRPPGYRHGADSYVCKPVDFDQFSRLLRDLGSCWLALDEAVTRHFRSLLATLRTAGPPAQESRAVVSARRRAWSAHSLRTASWPLPVQ